MAEDEEFEALVCQTQEYVDLYVDFHSCLKALGSDFYTQHRRRVWEYSLVT